MPGAAPDDLPFDPGALRARYAAERAKRLRADGKDQYLEVAGDLAGFAADRLGAAPSRPPLDESLDRKSTRLNSSHVSESRMPSSA